MYDLPPEIYINRAHVRNPERDSHARPFARHLSIKRSSAFAFTSAASESTTHRKYYLHARRGGPAAALGIVETYELIAYARARI